MGQIRDKERVTLKASHVEASSRADDLAIRLLQSRSYIHTTLSLECGSADEPNEA